ncbi:hypothetical protein [Haloplanus halophilus]|uniref:hypothetical protein n=1 Tax=Haloplanus halophilus TaxID=2949993 RepID=UPI00203DCE4F|nr:hypothetical protein [Haloplanus sp. GDY1]
MKFTTLSDGDTYADVRFGDDFIVTVDRTAPKDAITVRVFHPDIPEKPVGEHHLGLGDDHVPTPEARSETDSAVTDHEGATG